MAEERYQEYLRLIGNLKDVFNLHVDVDHKNIHEFYDGKRPLFKLFFGMFTKTDDPTIVVSFHVDLQHSEAIRWWHKMVSAYPRLALHDSYIEDSSGETYLGEDAMAIKEVFQAQTILTQWLETSTREDMEQFVKAPVTGREREAYKSFDSHHERTEAIIEFERVRKPSDDESIH